MRKRIAGAEAPRIGPTAVSRSSNGTGTSNGSTKRKSAASRRTQIGGNGSTQIEAPKPLPKTTLKAAELEYFKSLLLQKRNELLGDVNNMEREALRKNRSDASGDLSMMPIHMADIGTDNYEQEFTIGLIASERETLKEIDEALGRVADGTYGMCLGTHSAIPKARLRAKPWARYCVEYKRAQESQFRRRPSGF